MVYDPIVIAKRGAFLQRIADYVRTGHPLWVAGEIRLSRAPELAAKFERVYRVAESKSERHRARRRKQGTAVLLLHGPYASPERSPTAHDPSVCWVLLLDDGPHAAREREQLRDARQKDGRMSLLGYELVCMTKPGVEGTVWTWRMPAARFEHWRTRMLQSARRRSLAELAQTLGELYNTLGFFGARSQVGQLMVLFRREWKRRRREPLPPPRSLLYLQRVPTEGPRLSGLTRRLRGRDASATLDSADG